MREGAEVLEKAFAASGTKKTEQDQAEEVANLAK